MKFFDRNSLVCNPARPTLICRSHYPDFNRQKALVLQKKR
jgi:hypothetical protein